MKTLLVMGMIIAHVYQLLHDNTSIWLHYFSTYINLVTFSGFFFVFGFLYKNIYFSREEEKAKRSMRKSCYKLLGYYYVSALSFVFLFNDGIHHPILLAKTLIFAYIPGYSEFLLSFFAVNVACLILFRHICNILENNVLWLIFGAVSLCATNFPYEIVPIAALGSIIGSTRSPCFPIIQYGIYFIMGVCALNKQGKYLWIIGSLILSTIALFIIAKGGGIPKRFPPHFLWISMGLVTTWIYFYGSQWIYDYLPQYIRNCVVLCGKHTIDFLIISNVTLFILSYLQRHDYLPMFSASLIFFTSFFVISAIFIYLFFKQKYIHQQ